MTIRGAVDFAKIVNSIRCYEPPSDGLNSPFSLDASSVEPNHMTLTTLIEAIVKRDYEPEMCAFYFHPNNYNRLIQQDGMMVLPPGDSFQGRPIRTHPTMPEDCILFMAPDAVSLGGKVYHPGMIAYADLETPD